MQHLGPKPTNHSKRRRLERFKAKIGTRESKEDKKIHTTTQKSKKQGYDSEPDYTSQQKERNMRDRGWDSRGEMDRDLRDIPRHSGAGSGAGYGYGYPYEESHRSSSPPQLPYSQQPPHVRPEYLPEYEASPESRSTSQYPYYFSPPPMAPFPELDRDAGNYDSDERYEGEEERSHRPKYIQRRSSYDDIHDQRKSRPSKTDQRLATRDQNRRPRSDHGNGSNASHTGGMRDRADRYGLKDEVKGLFTDSPKGLAGGAIGALVGGWATEKFQEAQTGKDRKDMGGSG
ncbi:hypothetical protein DID88_004506 [Monilinia fructigena]|uniref:Uncharacterized protein n=1 Tax=Monilinia fructigena TaxID=38457 RepID=A0A395ITE6_9HELO|nr:hypothetical protein DID88_004506 [Monilinia fructigena]